MIDPFAPGVIQCPECQGREEPCWRCDSAGFIQGDEERRTKVENKLVPLTTEDKLAIRYGVTPEQIRAKREAFAALRCDTPKGYDAVRLAIAECRTTRTAIEAKRKELKADALEYGRKVDAVAKSLTEPIEQIEGQLREKKAAVDEVKARAKAEKEAAEKAALEAQLRAEREAEEARIRAEREAEAARLAAEREAQRIEAERLAAERKALEEAQRQAREAEERRAAEERARIEAERQKLEAERRAIEEARAAEENRARLAREEEARRVAALRQAEEARLAAERAELDRQRQETERLERERLARVAAEEAAERVKKEAAALAERARLEAEEFIVRERERQAQLKARLEALRPDADKLRAWAEQLTRVPPPDVTSDEAKLAIVEAGKTLDALVERLRGFDSTAARQVQEAAE